MLARDVIIYDSAATASSPPPPPPPPGGVAQWDLVTAGKKPGPVEIFQVTTVSAANDTTKGIQDNYGTIRTIESYDNTLAGGVAITDFVINDVDGSIGLCTADQHMGAGTDGYLGNGQKTGIQLTNGGHIYWNDGDQGNTGIGAPAPGDIVRQRHFVGTGKVTWELNFSGTQFPHVGDGFFGTDGFDISTIQPSFVGPFYGAYTTNVDGGVTILSANYA